jgi:peptidoglycan/LPS O-acetylase OafA/YrhL
LKRHFEILDGLRGTAAFLVVIYHLMGSSTSNSFLHHGYLAVDFFYMLSGFVIGYAYDDRWTSMKFSNFLKTRFIRLHPLMTMGVVLGSLCYIFDPYVGYQQHVSPFLLIFNISLSLISLPSPSLPNCDNLTHSINGPSWSLFQEYLANILYGLVGKKSSIKLLILLVIASGCALMLVANTYGNLDIGWEWSTIWAAPIRTAFPFLTGLLMYRVGYKIKISWPFTLLSILLGTVFSTHLFHHNGLFEALCVIFLFPIIILTAAWSDATKSASKLCKILGGLSYPIYIIHAPIIMVFLHWKKSHNPTSVLAFCVASSVIFLITSLSWILLKYYDEPVRVWLKRRLSSGVKTQ